VVIAVQQVCEENPEHAEAFRLRAEPEAAQIRASRALLETDTVPFEWSAVGGTDWLREILPASVATAAL
jgi:hypothetical protein